jgi:dephospho-CoA kinase
MDSSLEGKSTSLTDFNTLQVGLTGSIGMGKSSVSSQLIKLGFPVFDADKEVHKLYSAGGGAVESIRDMFPDAIADNSVNRTRLMEHIMKNSSSLKDIERIVHPLVIKGRKAFYDKCNREGHLLVVYDIPLLFENRANYEVDYVIVVTADEETQRKRVLSRPGMTVEKFEAILLKQVPDSVKRSQADFLIHTDYPGYTEARAQLARIIETIIVAHPGRWRQWKARSLQPPEKSVSFSENPPTVHAIKAAYDIVLFDLDNTLVPLMRQLKPALEGILAFVHSNMPKSAEDISQHLRARMTEIGKENSLLAHDLTALRYRAMEGLAAVHGEEEQVAEAMKLFIRIRSDISLGLYNDVMDCFRWLSSMDVRIGIMTNGNADILETEANKEVNKFLSLCLHAGDIGVMKPSPVVFVSCSQVAGTVAGRVLYVGDDYDKDVVGSRNAGMTGVMLVRDEAAATSQRVEWSGDRDEYGDDRDGGDGSGSDTCSGVVEYPDAAFVLTSLRPKEFERKLMNHLQLLSRAPPSSSAT